jgi:hypothetical protein
MAAAEFFEKLFSRAHPAVRDVVEALPDGFVNIGASGLIE